MDHREPPVVSMEMCSQDNQPSPEIQVVDKITETLCSKYSFDEVHAVVVLRC